VDAHAPETERSSFGADRLRLLAELEGSHFWFAGRRALAERLIDRHVEHRIGAALDVGCGTGAFLPVLDRYAERVVGVEPLAASPTPRIIPGEAEDLPFDSATFDLAVALDVLEHVDDRRAIDELARVVRPRGWLILTVPAFPSLWSERDTRAGHRRRYRRRHLTGMLESAQFDVVETAYYQFFLFPFLVASRLLGRLRPRTADVEERPPAMLNGLLRRLGELEVRAGEWIPWPWGSTLAVAAQRSAA
jgi:SAM-dependent methyltransferase